MSEHGGNWLDTDYETEGAHALEMTVEQLGKVLKEPHRWKWVIVCLHNSLQAFLVQACSGADLLGAMTESYQRHWHEQNEKGEQPTRQEQLASVLELLERAKTLRGYVYSGPLQLSEEQERAVRALSKWRNRFIHYKPGSLTIEVSGFPDIVGRCLDVIDFVAFKSGHIFTAETDISKRTMKALKQAQSRLRRVQKAYAATTP